jgi:UDP-N-acetylglucosamine diphosphorylase/glucosamine-1-phosphate N-acetyltransferase
MRFGLIMAGGLGKRMGSSLPKVLHEINEKPMIYYVIEKAFRTNCENVGIIVGKYYDIIKNKIDEFFPQNDKIVYILQNEPLGTGHAIKCSLRWMKDNLDLDTDILILSGDVPLISTETLNNLLEQDNSILITKTTKPDGCGRIIFNSNNNVKKIIEEKDCSSDELLIQYINCGIYNIKLHILLETIIEIKNLNLAKEYYLTDMIEIANNFGYKINKYELPEDKTIEIANINTQADLAYVKSMI